TGLTATAPVVVQPSDIAIEEPSPVTLGPNEVDTLHVVVPGQGGRIVSPLTMQWASADPNVARVSLTGVVTAVAPGKTTLSVPGLAYTWAIRVIAAALKLSATRVGLPLNRRYGLHASFADETGAVIGPATAVTFASDNPPAVAVAEDGTITAAGYGHARVTASAPGGKHA